MRSEKLIDFCHSDEVFIVIMKCFDRDAQHSGTMKAKGRVIYTFNACFELEKGEIHNIL